MGAPTKTQVEAWSDEIAAHVALAMTGYRNSYTSRTVQTLADAVDASGDFVVEGALIAKALAIDEMSLPANVSSWLPWIAQRPEYANFVTSLNTLIKSAEGGGYASLRAYLVDKSAKLHHLAGEVVRNTISGTPFTSSSVVAGVSNPLYGAMAPTRVYVGADGSLTSELTDALSAATGDVTLFANDDETLYIGSDRPFQGVVLALSTLANATITPTFQYWNGSAWATLTVTDNTVGLTKSELISFTAPADWSRSYKDAGGTALAVMERLYYIRIARTANTLDTPPVGTAISLIPTAIPMSANNSAHAPIDQPPLAICRITAASTMTVTLPANIDGTRYAYPVGTESKLRARALTAIAQDLTITLAYVNGSAANGSTAQSSWTAPAAFGTKTLALTSTDALASVRTTSSVSTSATTGVFVIEALPIRDPAV